MRTPVQNPNHLRQSRKIIETVVLETSPHIDKWQNTAAKSNTNNGVKNGTNPHADDLASRKNRDLAR